MYKGTVQESWAVYFAYTSVLVLLLAYRAKHLVSNKEICGRNITHLHNFIEEIRYCLA
jgi:hypothetical protein